MFKSCDPNAKKDEYNRDIQSCREYFDTHALVVSVKTEDMPLIKARNKLYRYIKDLREQEWKLVEKLTQKFLKDEARKLKQRKLYEFRRILKKLAKKWGLTI